MKFLNGKYFGMKIERLKIYTFWANSVIGHNKVQTKTLGDILSDGIILCKVYSNYSDELSEDFFKEYSNTFNKLNNIRSQFFH